MAMFQTIDISELPDPIFLSDEYMSTVSRVLYRKRWVSLKQFPKDSHTEPRFQREIAAFLDHEGRESLSHPHVLKLFGTCVQTNGLGYVFEHASVNLEEYWENITEKQTSDQVDFQIKWISLGIAKGLSYVHANRASFFQLELNPSKILMVGFPEPVRPVLSDLGCLESENFLLFQYAAPEAFSTTNSRENEPTQKANIYAFGGVVLFLLTNNDPWGEMSPFGVIQAQKAGETPKLPEGCPNWCRTLLPKCWESNPTKRPTAGALVDEIQNSFFEESRWTCKRHNLAKHSIFITFQDKNEQDSRLAIKMARTLERKGFSVFLKSTCLKEKEGWERAFESGLLVSPIVIVLVSKVGCLKIDATTFNEPDSFLFETEMSFEKEKERSLVVPVFVDRENNRQDLEDWKVNIPDGTHVKTGTEVKEVMTKLFNQDPPEKKIWVSDEDFEQGVTKLVTIIDQSKLIPSNERFELTDAMLTPEEKEIERLRQQLQEFRKTPNEEKVKIQIPPPQLKKPR